jgi:hypothetical protein
MLYNFDLYNKWADAAMKLDLEMYSQHGGAIYLKDPKTDTIVGKEGSYDQQFWFMLWTPLNKLPTTVDDLNEHNWRFALDTLKDNHEDFHIEADKMYGGRSTASWFPEIKNCTVADITVDNIITCVKRIRNFDGHAKQQTLVTLRTDYSDQTNT